MTFRRSRRVSECFRVPINMLKQRRMSITELHGLENLQHKKIKHAACPIARKKIKSRMNPRTLTGTKQIVCSGNETCAKICPVPAPTLHSTMVFCLPQVIDETILIGFKLKLRPNSIVTLLFGLESGFCVQLKLWF